MHTPIGDIRPSYMPGFKMPLVSRDFPYGMPTAMMAGLQSNTSTYTDNNATIMSPKNLYVVSGSAIRNPGRATQHRGTAFAVPNTFSLTTNSMLSIRKQMDESNHKMVYMLTQQIGTLFNPQIHNTN